MARPRLPIGSWGEIWTEPTSSGRVRARARFRDLDGVTRRVAKTGRSKAAAKAALVEEMQRRARPGGLTTDLTADSLVGDAITLWLADADLAVQSRRRYQTTIDRHLTPALQEVTLREVTVARVDGLLRTLGRKVGPGAAQNARAVLSNALGLAVRHGAIPTNPVKDAGPVARAKTKGPRALTLEQVRELRAGAVAWDRGVAYRGIPAYTTGPPRSDAADVVEVLLGTGARIGEVLALRWPDVDLKAGTIVVSGTIVRGEHGPERQDHGKTATSHRVLTAPKFVVDALRRRKLERPATLQQLVFPSQTGGVRDPNSFRAVLGKIRAGVELEWVTPHTFRDTVATLIDAEADLRTASEQLGHAGTDVTRRHYVERSLLAPDVRTVLDALAPADQLATYVEGQAS
ncbi:site-specific integrase [Mariniluteicoccus endophyticus]